LRCILFQKGKLIFFFHPFHLSYFVFLPSCFLSTFFLHLIPSFLLYLSTILLIFLLSLSFVLFFYSVPFYLPASFPPFFKILFPPFFCTFLVSSFLNLKSTLSSLRYLYLSGFPISKGERVGSWNTRNMKKTTGMEAEGGGKGGNYVYHIRIFVESEVKGFDEISKVILFKNMNLKNMNSIFSFSVILETQSRFKNPKN